MTVNTAEIVIQAVDRASATNKAVAVSFGAIGVAAQQTLKPISLLSESIQTLASVAVKAGGAVLLPFQITNSIVGGTINSVFRLLDSFARLQGVFNSIVSNPVVGVAIESSLQQAESAVESFDATLTETLGGVGAIAGDVLTGFLPGIQQFRQEASGAIDQIGSKLSGLSTSIGGSVGSALNKVDGLLLAVTDKAERIPQRLAGNISSVAGIFKGLAGFDEPLAVFDALRTGVAGATGGIFRATQEIAFFTSGLQALQQFVLQSPFQLLIGQNIELREQLLATQSTLAATNKVFQNGQQITDPTIAIQALQGPIENAIADLRKGSLELVGVTSQELVPLFQQVAGQSANIGASLNDSKELALSFAASLGTLGIPLFQARQEIGSILSGTIDVNSVLANAIGLNSKQVNLWKSQGVLVQELGKRLEAFRAGNALAAQTIGGISSNIEELFQEIGRQAGQKFLDPLVAELNTFYSFLQNNSDGLASTIESISDQVFKATTSALEAIKTLFSATQSTLGAIPDYLFRSFANAIEAISGAIVNFVEIIKPVLTIFGELAKKASPLAGTFLQLYLQLKVFSTGIGLLSGGFGVLSQILPGIGELLFFISGRNNSLVRSFAGLRSEIGLGAAGFLLLGKNFAAFPALAGLLSKKIPIFGNAIASLIPTIAGLSTQLVGLISVYPKAGAITQQLTSQLPQLAVVLAPFAERILPGLSGDLAIAANKAKSLGEALGKSTPQERIAAIEDLTNATGRFSNLMQLLGKFLATTAIKFSLFAAGAFIAIQAIDQFILKNENVLNALKAFSNGVIALGSAVASFLSNPFVIATGAVVALGAAIKAGLIPSLSELTGTFISVGGQELKKTFTGLTESLSGLSNTLTSTKFELGGGGKRLAALKAEGSAIASELKAQSLDFQEAIAERRKKLAELNDRIDRVPSFIDASGLKKQREELLAETVSIVNERKAQKDKLSQINTEIANIESKPKKGNLKDFFRQTSEQISFELGGAKKRLASLKVEGDSIKKELDRQSFYFQESIADRRRQIAVLNEQIKIAPEGTDVSGFQRNREQLLLEAKELADIRKQQKARLSEIAVEAATLETKLQGGGLQRFSKGLKGFISSLRAVAGEFIATAAPIAALVVAITVVTEAIGVYQTLTDASTQATKNFTAAIEESNKKVNQLTAQRSAEAAAAAKSEEDLRADRLKKIKEEQGIVTKFFEFLRSNTKGVLDVLGNLATGFGLLTPVFNAVGSTIAGVADALGKAFPIVKPIIDAIQGAVDVIRNLGSTQADVQLNLETQGFDDAANAASTELERIKGQFNESVKLEQSLAELQVKRTEAAKANNKQEVSELDAKIKKTKEEIDARKAAVDAVLNGVKAQQPLNDRQRKDQANLITQIEAYRKSLDEIADTQIAPPDLPKLGTALDQLKEKADQALAAVSKSTGLPEEFKVKAQELIKLTTQQLQLGQITEEEARSRLARLANNVNADAETQLAAQDAITDSYKKEGDRRVAAYEVQQSAIEAQVARGEISQSEGERRITENKIEQLQIRLEAAKAELEQEIEQGQGSGEKAIALQKEIAQSQAEIDKTIQEQRQKNIERAINRATEAITSAEKQRQIAIARLQLAGADPTEIEEIKAKVTRDRIGQELALENQKLKLLSQNGKANESEIKASRQRILDLTLQAAEAEITVQDRVAESIKKQIDQQTKAIENGINAQNEALNSQKDLLDSLNQSYEERNKLLQAQQSLVGAAGDFLTGQIDAASKLETSEFRKRQLAQITAAIQLQSLTQRQELERQIFEIQQEQNKLALDRQKIENEIAQAQQEAAVIRGEANIRQAQVDLERGKITQQEYDAVVLTQRANLRQLEATQRQGQLIERQIALQPQLERAGRLQLDLQQQGARTQAETTFIEALPPGQRRSQLREGLRDRVAGNLGFENFRDLRSGGLQAVGDIANRLLRGEGAGTAFLDRLAPNTRTIGSELQQQQQLLAKPQPLSLGSQQPFTANPIAPQNAPQGAREGQNIVQVIQSAFESLRGTITPQNQKSQPVTIDAPITVPVTVTGIAAGVDAIATQVDQRLNAIVVKARQIAGATPVTQG